jgi:hypothetical protein
MVTATDLFGAWNAAGQDRLNPDGTITQLIPASAPGRIMYTPEGFMSVVATNGTPLPTTEPTTLTEAQRAAAAMACTAYTGRWELKDGQLFHHIDAAVFPAWIGQSRIRIPKIDGDLLTLTMLPDPTGAVGRVYWRRAK